jgi:hypothetical protein
MSPSAITRAPGMRADPRLHVATWLLAHQSELSYRISMPAADQLSDCGTWASDHTPHNHACGQRTTFGISGSRRGCSGLRAEDAPRAESAGYLVAAWYCSATLTGMRPRSLTAMPWVFAHARMSPLRSRADEVRTVRRR